jgi:hypothetical protein
MNPAKGNARLPAPSRKKLVFVLQSVLALDKARGSARWRAR